jgi:ATP-dependent Clp protease adaptor protein ClpS
MSEKETKKSPGEWTDEVVSDNKTLVLHNDDVHTFDYVIDALMEICQHEYIQASQCATITHYKGKCDIKEGNFPALKRMKDALVSRELTVTID